MISYEWLELQSCTLAERGETLGDGIVEEEIAVAFDNGGGGAVFEGGREELALWLRKIAMYLDGDECTCEDCLE